MVKCPINPPKNDDQPCGCGHEFEGEPDHDGMIQCPQCMIFFNPVTDERCSPGYAFGIY